MANINGNQRIDTIGRIIIRPETEDDFAQIKNVVQRAFDNIEESDHTEHLLVERLRQSDAYIPLLSLVAEIDNKKIVGHILLSKVEIIAPTGTKAILLGVAPLSVLPDFQSKGIGGMLLNEAHKRASNAGYGGAVLLGHPTYYPKFGYKKATDFGIRFPFDVPEEYCMVIELSSDGLKKIQGVVHYSKAFYE